MAKLPETVYVVISNLNAFYAPTLLTVTDNKEVAERIYNLEKRDIKKWLRLDEIKGEYSGRAPDVSIHYVPVGYVIDYYAAETTGQAIAPLDIGEI